VTGGPDPGQPDFSARRAADAAIEVLAAKASSLREALDKAVERKLPRLILDGTLVSSERCADKKTSKKGRESTTERTCGPRSGAHLDAVTEHAAAPVVAKYTGVLGGADIEIFTRTTTFAIMQSIRLDRGPSGPVHP
jgi:hypothetical protein